jgi:hypothetical protein
LGGEGHKLKQLDLNLLKNIKAMKQKTYKVPVAWQMYGYVTVQANDKKHAFEIADADMAIGLPDNGTYVEGSWEADWELLDENDWVMSDKKDERHRELVIGEDGTVKEVL